MSVSALDELARRLGADVSVVDRLATDEHARWAVLSEALGDIALHPLVLAATRDEPDSVMAASVVTSALEVVAPGERATWVAALPAEERAYAARRADDLEMLDNVLDGRASPEEVAALPDRTPWLQLRVAGTARDPATLTVLEGRGTTRRVRGAARQRLIELRKGRLGR
ncbi:hypothetical protein [Nocardioides zeae]|uniref:Uncharacterized protein n=1 Tax=Nocardioides zeae TaxID=1457234 RepID=A0A6P0HFD7_9ACTN|nr:hypothetical protein [Nocardioides zeae]NEN77429.1 hypothetical protein [Nocardioides zeae]